MSFIGSTPLRALPSERPVQLRPAHVQERGHALAALSAVDQPSRVIDLLDGELLSSQTLRPDLSWPSLWRGSVRQLSCAPTRPVNRSSATRRDSWAWRSRSPPVRERNVTPRSRKLSSIVIKSRKPPPSRSSFHTVRVSPSSSFLKRRNRAGAGSRLRFASGLPQGFRLKGGVLVVSRDPSVAVFYARLPYPGGGTTMESERTAIPALVKIPMASAEFAPCNGTHDSRTAIAS